MARERLSAWRRRAETLGAAFIVLVVGAGVFVWSGLYNVSAARDHFPVTTWILELVREQSIATQSAFVETPRLDDGDLARLGAAHYEGGCVPCHARPGEPINPIVRRMLPPPPGLAQVLTERRPEAIFWIVKHGLKYTGMPAWAAEDRDDEVWALTAFLARLAPQPDASAYRALAGVDRVLERPPVQVDEAAVGALMQCERCHDDAGLATHGALVPRLAGQSPDYLRRALAEYAAGTRPSGVMQAVAAALDPAEMDRFAAHYGALAAPAPEPAAEPGTAERGRQLAQAGDPALGIPPCLSCHGPARDAAFPSLDGQHARYLAGQLELWRRGGRAASPHGRIMAAVGRRLSPADAAATAAYFAARTPVVPARAADAAGSPP